MILRIKKSLERYLHNFPKILVKVTCEVFEKEFRIQRFIINFNRKTFTIRIFKFSTKEKTPGGMHRRRCRICMLQSL